MQRRSFLMGLGAAAFGPRTAIAADAAPRRLVSMDYALTETLLSMGIVPLAQANATDWDEWVGEPKLPESVIEIGSDSAPNFELLAALKPDRFLTTPYLDLLRPYLDALAPTTRIGIYDEAEGLPFEKSLKAATALGALYRREADAAAFLARADATFADCAARIARLPKPPLPLHLVSFIDPRHVWIYGRTSLFQGVLDRLGLENAWTEDTNYWGFGAIGIERLADGRPTRLVGFDPVPADVLPTLQHSPLWRELPSVRAGEVTTLPTVLRFGGLTSAMRFAELLTADLERAAS